MIGSLLNKVTSRFAKTATAMDQRAEAIVSQLETTAVTQDANLPPIIGAPATAPCAPQDEQGVILTLSAIFPDQASAQTVADWSLKADNCLDAHVEEGTQGIAIWSASIKLLVGSDANQLIQLENTMKDLAKHLNGQFSGSNLQPIPAELLTAPDLPPAAAPAIEQPNPIPAATGMTPAAPEMDPHPQMTSPPLVQAAPSAPNPLTPPAAQEPLPAPDMMAQLQATQGNSPQSVQPAQPQPVAPSAGGISGIALAAEETMFGGEVRPVGKPAAA